MKKQAGKVSYNVHRWNNGGFHYGQTVTITRAQFDAIVKSFSHDNADILARLKADIEYTINGAFTNISQAQFIAGAIGINLKDGYNTYFKWVKDSVQ